MTIAQREKGEKMYLIDTRKYDDSFLLAKILEKVDFSDEETKKLFKHFEKSEAVDVKPIKYGHWVFDPKDAIEMMFTLPRCSECGAESPNGGNYCPNCGAKMDLE